LDHQALDKKAAEYAGEFASTEKTRAPKEEEWLQSLRQSRGIHDPEIKFGENDSRIYSQYTRSKEVPLRAKLNQHLLPEKEKNFEVTPTPKPRVPETELQGIIEPLITQDEQGTPVFPTDKEIDSAIRTWTEERAAKMSSTIDDQLTESDHRSSQKDQIKSGIRYGTGIIKGPLTKRYKQVETVWQGATGIVRVLDMMKGLFAGQQKPIGRWIQQETEKFRPIGESVPIWYWYPDMSTSELEKCGFAYELHPMTRHEMLELAGRPDFFGDVVRGILAKYSNGNYKPRSWEMQLQTLDPNATGLTVQVEPGRTVNTSSSGTAVDSNKYEVVERNGYIDGALLAPMGLVDDPGKEYFCGFWLCDQQCIKISVWPEKVISAVNELYHAFYYEKDETSVFGTGLPRVIRDRQLATNAGERHLLGHAAWLVAPCGDINVTLLTQASAKVANKFGPGSFYASMAHGAMANQKVLNLYDIQDNTASLINLVNFQRNQGDQEASLPSALFGYSGSTGDGETAKGVTVRWESLIDFIKDLAKNWDVANTSFIKGTYRWNMAFNQDLSIKGDMEIKAIGSVQALIKDAIRQEIGFILQSMPDELKPYFKWEEVARILGKTFTEDTQKLVRTQAEVDKMQAPALQKQQEMDQMQAMLAQIKGYYDQAKADAQAAKAEKIRAEIPHDQERKAIDNEKAKTDILKGNLENARTHVEIQQAKKDLESGVAVGNEA
jgi:hypothetical protein